MKKHRSLEEYIENIESICLIKGFILINVGKFEGNITRVILKCKEDGFVWKSTFNKMEEGRGCPECKNTKSSSRFIKDDDKHIKDIFKSGAFLSESSFWRIDKKLWGMRCPKCSNDDFVKNGICDGIFRSDLSNLKSGILPCRCSLCYRWNEQERTQQVETVMQKSSHLSFVSWQKGYQNTKSYMLINCKIHGNSRVKFADFYFNGVGCAKCSRHGFKPDKISYIYILKITGRQNFCGYGISNVIEQRLSTHVKNLNKDGFSIVEHAVFEMDGYSVQNIEKYFLNNFTINPQITSGFIREATLIENYYSLIDYIKDKYNGHYIPTYVKLHN